jgi:hypothetical protein
MPLAAVPALSSSLARSLLTATWRVPLCALLPLSCVGSRALLPPSLKPLPFHLRVSMERPMSVPSSLSSRMVRPCSLQGRERGTGGGRGGEEREREEEERRRRGQKGEGTGGESGESTQLHTHRARTAHALRLPFFCLQVCSAV